ICAASAAELVAPIIAHLNANATPWLLIHDSNEPIVAAAEIEHPLIRRAMSRAGDDPAADWRAAFSNLETEAAAAGLQVEPVAIDLMPALDPAVSLAALPAKTTVTQLRRARETEDAVREDELFVEPEMLGPAFTRESSLSGRKPAWTAGKIKIDGAMRGSWTHALLANVALDPPPTPDILRATMSDLIARNLIDTAGIEQDRVLNAIDFDALEWFFSTELGRDMCARAGAVNRELPFSARRPIFDLDPAAGSEHPTESFLLQGVIDAVIDGGDRATLIDYKTEYIADDRALAKQIEKHRLQIETYANCLKSIWNLREVKTALIFLHLRRVIWME
ncbi:PD-(D/E)XK nuclease family protein, partial [bacterium]|nr:PD-(D/E)XK nuclease family protein [bacterium]